MNPLYSQLNQGNNGNAGSFLQRFNRFRQSFNGDPKQQVQQLLNSGRISQSQYDNAVRQAQSLAKILGMK